MAAIVARVGTVKHLTRHPVGSLIVTLAVVAHDAKTEELALFARADRTAEFTGMLDVVEGEPSPALGGDRIFWLGGPPQAGGRARRGTRR